MNIKINDRVISKTNSSKVIDQNEKLINRYNSLKKQLQSNFKNEVYNRIETMKILKEIKDNEYYKLDGYKTFDGFIKDYKLAKSQVYDYLKVAKAIEKGIIEEVYLLENGFKNTIILLRNSDSNLIKKSRRNPIKPLRFQLKRQDSYDFYKKNAKLTGFILDELFSNQKDLLKKFIDNFKLLK
ncbi:chromosome replication/partitioning protein (plasmid) [Borrelia miyamotoi]|uniref:chromosome replication/partitioning protein n=1 Tax=Borrelia miyamotoi TaxID=47466 RepID=UPI00105599AF|nr:chromosome replication/partitioning protein [Borrelia miyamotoi]WAZ71184.1 chromosome replication/partitioning protein [Borrelia miyamotoi]WDS47480.1 chromosome replication/partitioning protein [Borrelia miyamotoi]